MIQLQNSREVELSTADQGPIDRRGVQPSGPRGHAVGAPLLAARGPRQRGVEAHGQVVQAERDDGHVVG